ncbi:Metallo-hydrolase/oxidoreductase [Bimuria novae-zelandiae CBS 107.79]|uniref:Metallo-hydrolase/oxidoreductase n=1 Tax=Bimuria novae-zelandiae CBS 107.79 TaxID=1447943 RepID=A0A6A5VPI8_9PLEO|nr:Metallo-hydrolase/oxidoreductase [Bimuria novae-zelandiae CBS 107.79]
MSSAGGVGAASATLYAVVSNPTAVGAKPKDADEKAHHLKGGKGFINPWDSFRDFVGWQMGLRMLWRKFSGQVRQPDTTPPTVPVVTPTFREGREGGKLRATWLGHACYYVEFPSGLRVLFDPVFEDCCAPIKIKSLKRFTPVPCEIEDLPTVDLVVISHNHYDHLSYPTIKRIQKAFPQVHFFAPLGNRSWFVNSGVPEANVTELDWWDTRDVKLQSRFQDSPKEVDTVSVSKSETSTQSDITALVGALPCQHVSARGPFDKCKTLWASWSVESGGAKVYFAGDTGYRAVPGNTPEGEDGYGPEYAHLPVCPAFKQIGEHRGPFDLGLIPIGAYEPRWVMSPMHANPEDSANIFIETKCKKALGMHWGTWVLTEEDVLEPPRKLKEALKQKGIAEEGVFGVTDIGESKEFESGA